MLAHWTTVSRYIPVSAFRSNMRSGNGGKPGNTDRRFQLFAVPCRRAALSTSDCCGCASARRAFDSAILTELVRATLATVRLRFFLMAVSGRDHRRIEDAIDALRQGHKINSGQSAAMV